MWIGGHAQVGWFVAWALGLDRRDRTLAAIAGMLPDVDAITRLGGVDAYLEGHHTYTHNLAAAVLFPLLLVGFARRRFWIYPVGVVAILLHFLSDGFGLLPLRPLWPSSRLMWWPQAGVERVATWQASRMLDQDYNAETGAPGRGRTA